MAKQRSIITPEHFTVAPGILGLPLASPSRRAYAMAIDGILVLLLTQAGAVFLGLAAAFILFRASRPEPGSSFLRWSVRTGLRVTGAILVFVVIIKLVGSARDRIERAMEPDEEPAAAAPMADIDELNLNLSAGDALRLARPLMTLRAADDSVEVANAAENLFRMAQHSGASSDNLYASRAGLINLMGERADSGDIRAVDRALRAVAGEPASVLDADTLMRAYIAAVERGDTVASTNYRDSVKLVLAGRQISNLESSLNRTSSRSDSLARELEQAREARGFRLLIAGFADDLGVGFGWSAVYFTAFLALWRGQTPGKRLAGVRVLRLDGKPLGWWLSFERFGGYAASFSVGLLGFFQILWDRNRQGLHDKACETVVVRDSPQARART